MATQTTTQTPSPKLQMFYKPQPGQPGYDANNPQAVYDSSGNLISLQQYQQATGQTGTDPSKIDWSAVQSGTPIGGFQSSTPQAGDNSWMQNPAFAGLADIWPTLTPSQQAFAEGAYTTVMGQYNVGGAASADPSMWQQALQYAANSPDIQAKYGDAAKEGAQQLAFDVANVTGNYNAAMGAQQATIAQQQKDLATQIAQAGQGYSGFAQQAKNELQAQNNQVIQSTRSQYANQLQNLGSQYEKQFGSSALGGAPALTLGASGPNQLSYNPVGGVMGTNPQAQLDAESNYAVGLGSLPSASRTTGVVSTLGTGGQ